jgi:hypothetical protein
MTKVSPTNLLSQVESTNVLRDIKPPVDIPGGWTWLAWVLGTAALLALLFWLWRWWSRGKSAEIAQPYIPAHVRARKRLREALLYIDQPREFCIRVSDAIRWYLEERFSFRAPERTTEEFLLELKRTDLLTPMQKTSLGDFLERCDLVKFARYEPAEPELRDLYQSALRLVEETVPAEETEVKPGAGAGGATMEHSTPDTKH